MRKKNIQDKHLVKKINSLTNDEKVPYLNQLSSLNEQFAKLTLMTIQDEADVTIQPGQMDRKDSGICRWSNVNYEIPTSKKVYRRKRKNFVKYSLSENSLIANSNVDENEAVDIRKKSIQSLNQSKSKRIKNLSAEKVGPIYKLSNQHKQLKFSIQNSKPDFSGAICILGNNKKQKIQYQSCDFGKGKSIYSNQSRIAKSKKMAGKENRHIIDQAIVRQLVTTRGKQKINALIEINRRFRLRGNSINQIFFS